MNGQQKPLAAPALLACFVVVVTATAAATLAFVAAIARPLPTAFLSAHFYM